jgi:hypothetical protein
MRKLRWIACLALAVALMASPVAAEAAPARGLWTGTETKYWTGKKWQGYSAMVPFSFQVKRGKVVRFRTSSSYTWPSCTGGEAVTAKLPITRKAGMHAGRFRGKQTSHVGSRKLTMYVSGRFASSRSARGKIVVKLAGCPPYRSLWTANSGVNANGIHVPICRGQNIMLEDGTYYYNPCAYIAGAS